MFRFLIRWLIDSSISYVLMIANSLELWFLGRFHILESHLYFVSGRLCFDLSRCRVRLDTCWSTEICNTYSPHAVIVFFHCVSATGWIICYTKVFRPGLWLKQLLECFCFCRFAFGILFFSFFVFYWYIVKNLCYIPFVVETFRSIHMR